MRLSVHSGQGGGNLVPQRINADEDVTLAFRVRSPKRDGKIIITQNGIVILTKSFKRAVPAEMMHINVQ